MEMAIDKEQAIINDDGEKLNLGIKWGELRRTPQEIEWERRRWRRYNWGYPEINEGPDQNTDELTERIEALEGRVEGYVSKILERFRRGWKESKPVSTGSRGVVEL